MLADAFVTTNPTRLAERALKRSIAVKEQVLQDHIPSLIAIAKLMARALSTGHRLYFCGNGGSLADAQHLAAEFLVRFRSHINRQALPALSLATDLSSVTACGNDFGFQDIFARSLAALGQAHDVLLVLSTSGNSANIIRVLEQAQHMGIITTGFLGHDGGKASALCDQSFIVPSTETARIQEAHITAGHIITEIVEDVLHTTGYLQTR